MIATSIPYAQARIQIQNGDAFLFEPTSNPFDPARLIAWWDRSRFSHVAMAIWLEDRLFCLEAKDGMCVRLYLLSDYLLYGRKVHWFKIRDTMVNGNHGTMRIDDGPVIAEVDRWEMVSDIASPDRNKMVEFGMGQLGRNYIHYWKMILDFILLGRPKAHAVRTTLRGRDALPVWFCSDLYAATVQAGGAVLPNGLIPYHTQPEEVAEFPFLKEQGLLVP